ncbi:MAG: F0F1 ATP synthase subunit alpha, partial [Rhodospirillaceae bacterium]|nr:F0F1 ATP synthase subunit alpha [Rhodospirillaceae bacterium]
MQENKTAFPSILEAVAMEAADIVDSRVRSFHPAEDVAEIGVVRRIGAGVAEVSGLRHALADELVQFQSGSTGIVSDLQPGKHGVILLGASDEIQVGEDVRRSHRVASTPVGDALLGRVVDPLGRPLDNLGDIAGPRASVGFAPIEAPAPAIIDRGPVARPLATGIKVVDAAIPIGRGQRELIIGDRQTGKTSLAVDAMLNQADSDVICVYCAIGQRGDAVARVVAALRDSGMLKRTIVVVAAGEAAPGLNFIAPYAATTMAEHFVAQGRDALIVYDDLTRHARSYRELSLLLRRPPGREAFPGDIFYVHARLLERSAQLNDRRGGGSLTALPIVETQAENLAAYIPTNLISITDGQIYLSPRLVQRGQLPAVDLGKSVSRVGGKAQSPAFRAVAGDLRIVMSQFEELETFARFGTRLDEETRERLKRGRAVRAILRQQERQPLPIV